MTGRFIKLKKGKCVGQVEELDEIMDCLNEFDKYDVRQVKDNLTQEQLKEVPSHLADLYKQSCENLNSEQRAKLQHILNEFADVFSKHDLDLGCLTEVKHQINTGTAPPVKQRMRRTPLGLQDVEKQPLEKLLDAKVIRPSTSELASAPVLVRKRDGSVRWCIDYRALNDKNVKNCFPLPIIEDCLNSLQGMTTFSTLDLASGYYQIQLEDCDCKKTAFITRYGLFEHTRMGMGLCNAPVTFQRAMQLVLRGLT